MMEELRKRFKEVAVIAYEDDQSAIDCAMEDLEADGYMFLIGDD